MSSSADFNSAFSIPVIALEYRDLAASPVFGGAAKGSNGSRFSDDGSRSRTEIELLKEEFAERIKRERADAAQQAEQQMRQEYEVKLQAARAGLATTLNAFETQRDEYFARVEAEVVQLALAIAAKILHREAQVDPMLVAALVRMAVEKMREGSSITVRVSPGQAARWREYLAGQPGTSRIEVVEDAECGEQDCQVDTELGVASFGLDVQLKEIEQGFFDLLALRPVVR
jgi:flagellar assembly protein FliH